MKNKLLNIYISRFLSSFNLFLFIPFYPAWLYQAKVLSAVNISIVSALVIISLRSSSLLFANIIKKYPKKDITSFCLLLSIVVYLLIFFLGKFHIFYSALWYLLSIILGSLIAITSLALLSAIALNSDESKHRSNFASMNIALNLSTGIGALIGSYIMHYNASLLPLIPVLFSLATIYFSTQMPTDSPSETDATVMNKKNLLNKQPFVLFIIANILTFVGYAQFYDVFPIFSKPFIDTRIIGILFLLSGIVIVALQTLFTKIFDRVNQNISAVIGNLIFGLGIFLLLFATKNILYLCFLGVIIFSIGEIIFAPAYQAMAVKLYPTNNPVMALAIMLAGWGIGESLGTFLGVYAALHKIGTYSYIVGTLAIILAASIVFLMSKLITTREPI